MRMMSPLDRAIAALSAVLLGLAIQRHDGLYEPVALALVIVSIVALMFSLAGTRLTRVGGSESLVAVVLTAGTLNGIALLASHRPAEYLREPHPTGVLAAVAAAALCVVLLAVDRSRLRRFWFPSLLGIYVVLGVWLIRASPTPHVDVIAVHDAAIDALAAGESPYGITFPNIYGNRHNYPPRTVSDGRVLLGFPYPPFALLMTVPSQRLLGDIRYSDLLAVVVGAGFIGYAGGRIARLAATLVMFTPRTLFVLEQGWTESLAIGWLGATIYGIKRQRPWAPVAAGLLVSLKQYLVISLVLLPIVLARPWDGRRRWTFVLCASAVAAAITLPFIVWDPRGFWRSVIWSQLAERPRIGPLNLLSYAMLQGWSVPPEALTLVPLAALAVGLWMVWRWAPRTSGGFSLGLALVLLLVFVVSKKAFANYYYFALAAIAAGVAAEDPPPESSG